MPFLQLTFETGMLDPETLEAACFDAGALSVTLTDAADTPILEPDPGDTPMWPSVRASILFDAQANRAQIVNELQENLGRTLPEHSFSEVADRVWEREWLVDFKPMSFGRRLWVCPHGQNTAPNDATVVLLDPGLAFGTGTHASTALCLQWLDGADVTNKNVIDYGCGSGILAIAAVKLGARHVFAVDHDPQALLATRDNAAQNKVENRIEVLDPTAALPQVDVLLANILAAPLIEFAERFGVLVRPGGHLVLAGILAEQADAVAAAYKPWFDLQPPARQGEWVCLHGTRR